MSEPKKVGRRTFLNYAIAVVATGVIVGAATYFAVPKGEVTVTAPGTTVTKTVTTTVTGTPTTTLTPIPAKLAYICQTGPEMHLLGETMKWFMQEYPALGIEFTIDEVSRDVADLKKMAILNERANEYQFIYLALTGEVQLWINRGVLQPLEDILPAELIKKFADNVPEQVMMEFQKDGKTYALPVYWNSLCLFYRTDLFNDPKEKDNFKAKYGYDLRPPRTNKELIDIAKFFTRPPDLYGFAVCGKPSYFWHEFVYTGLPCAGLWPYVDIEKETTVVNSPKAVEVMQSIAELTKYSPPGWETADWFTFGDPLFAEGKLAMYHNWYYPWPTFQNPEKSKVVGKVGVAPIPTIDENTPTMTMLSGGGLGVNKFATEQQKKAAAEYLKWMLSDEVQKRMALTGDLFIPARKDILKLPEVSQKLKAEPFLELAEKTKLCKLTAEIRALQTQWQNFFAEALLKIVKGEMSAQEACNWLAEQIITIIKQSKGK